MNQNSSRCRPARCRFCPVNGVKPSIHVNFQIGCIPTTGLIHHGVVSRILPRRDFRNQPKGNKAHRQDKGANQPTTRRLSCSDRPKSLTSRKSFSSPRSAPRAAAQISSGFCSGTPSRSGKSDSPCRRSGTRSSQHSSRENAKTCKIPEVRKGASSRVS